MSLPQFTFFKLAAPRYLVLLGRLSEFVGSYLASRAVKMWQLHHELTRVSLPVTGGNWVVSKLECCLIFSTIHVASQERNLYPKISESILSYPFSFQLMETYYFHFQFSFQHPIHRKEKWWNCGGGKKILELFPSKYV